MFNPSGKNTSNTTQTNTPQTQATKLAQSASHLVLPTVWFNWTPNRAPNTERRLLNLLAQPKSHDDERNTLVDITVCPSPVHVVTMPLHGFALGPSAHAHRHLDASNRSFERTAETTPVITCRTHPSPSSTAPL